MTASLRNRLGVVGAAVVLAGTPLLTTPAEAASAATASATQVNASPVARVRFDRQYLIKTSHYVIQDMKTINNRLDDGIGVSSAFWMLSDSYDYMLHAGVPPKIVKKAAYKARIGTLSDFADKAGNEYSDDPTNALARYAVIRKQTRILFRQINGAIDTSLSVPTLK